jgi:ABC-2 type transport system permease protein
MLWYKAWLETRWRFVFMVGSILLIWLTPLWLPSFGFRLPQGVPASKIWMGVHLGSVLLYIIAANFLAGSGVNSQTTYAAASGFHGSMFFTLSLPVSRRRLLLVRAGLGALLTSALVAVLAGYTLLQRPGGASSFEVVEYVARSIVCTMAVYALSVLMACVLDEMWQFYATSFFWMAFYLAQSRLAVIAWISPLRGMSLFSYPANAPMPWAPIVASLAFAGICLCASVLVLQRKEY